MTTANSNKELIVKLDKEVALIKKDIDVIKNIHLSYREIGIKTINVVLWSVGFAVFSNLLILLRDIIL